MRIERILLLVLCSAMMDAAFAQFVLGVKSGLNISIYGTSIDPEPDEEMDLAVGAGFLAGGYMGYELSGKLGVRLELLYSKRATEQQEMISAQLLSGGGPSISIERESKYSFGYLEIPLLLTYGTGNGFSVHMGPALGLLLNARARIDETTTTTVDGTLSTSSFSLDSRSKQGLRNMEVGAVLGLGYEWENGVGLGLRYWRGLNTLNKTTLVNNTTLRTHANIVQASVGYSFIRPQRKN